eukprot:gene1124-1575_t
MSSVIDAVPQQQAAAAATLKLLTPADYGRWDAFVRAAPQATFFHLSAWQTLIQRCYGHKTWFYYVEQDGQIQGILGLCQIKSRLFGHSLSSLPFCVHGGVVALNDHARAMLDAAAAKLAGELGVAFLWVLERLSPDERAAFLLRQVFDYDYSEVADLLGKSEAACRQLVHRAQERVLQDRKRFGVDQEAHRSLLGKFLDAARTGQAAAIQALLAANVEL